MRILIILGILGSAAPAAAWDGGRNWWDDPDGANPGGGGLFATGGQRDHGIKCEDCHVDNPSGTFEARFQFTPALTETAGQFIYQPGQRYQVDVSMIGEVIVPTCDPYMEHTNNFAATFEDEDGASIGVLETDSGRIQSSCPPDWPMTAPAGTTGIYRDCEVVFAYGADRTTWRFWWTAPAAGAGTVSMFYGMVDGDCMMNSLDDVVVTGERVLREPSTAAAASPTPTPPRRAAGAGSVALLLAIAAICGRRSPTSRR
jgi:hypothetical protein